MDDIIIARTLHVLSVTHWIGGVAFVTLVALPLANATGGARGLELFEAIESRFAAQVRWSIPLAGASGIWMTQRMDLWSRFRERGFWWMDAMALVWLIFAVVVFIVEPLLGHRLEAFAKREPARALRRLTVLHLILLGLSAVTIGGAVAGAAGGL